MKIKLGKDIQYGSTLYKAGDVIEPDSDFYAYLKQQKAIEREVSSYAEKGPDKSASSESFKKVKRDKN